jgi:glutamate synthase (ferredoxin)
MSGGVAYVLDEAGDFERRCNQGMVDLESLYVEADILLVRDLIRKHAEYTHSARAAKVLANWDRMLSKFVKIMPRDYRRVLLAQEKAQSEGREPLWEELLGVQRG